MKKYNSCKKINKESIYHAKNKTNNIEEIIKIEENNLNNINKNKHLRENLTAHLIQRINLNPNKHKNLNHNSKQFVFKKVEKHKKNKS
jgi:capsule polysaccharide export protein KpsC/LpsZ